MCICAECGDEWARVPGHMCEGWKTAPRTRNWTNDECLASWSILLVSLYPCPQISSSLGVGTSSWLWSSQASTEPTGLWGLPCFRALNDFSRIIYFACYGFQIHHFSEFWHFGSWIIFRSQVKDSVHKATGLLFPQCPQWMDWDCIVIRTCAWRHLHLLSSLCLDTEPWVPPPTQYHKTKADFFSLIKFLSLLF